MTEKLRTILKAIVLEVDARLLMLYKMFFGLIMQTLI